MHSRAEYDQTEPPLMRITTLGEFALERLVRTPSQPQDEPPCYARVARSEWSNRGPAVALLRIIAQKPKLAVEAIHRHQALTQE